MSQPIELINLDTNSLDIIKPITSANELINYEQDYNPTTERVDPSIGSMLEDDSDSSIFLQSPEEPIATNNYLEVVPLAEIDHSVEDIFCYSEETMQQDEAEYIGLLLLSTLPSYEPTITAADNPEIQLSQDMIMKPENNLSIIVETDLAQDYEQRLTLLIETLSSPLLQITDGIIKELSDAVKDIPSLTESTTAEQEMIIEQKLEELCIKLFEGLNLDYDKGIINQMIHNPTLQKLFIDLVRNDNELMPDNLDYQGTREYKTTASAWLRNGLTQIINQKIKSLLMLGKYALQVTTYT